MRSSHYDILFEPVRIGPLTAKNRFYQVPHCNGMGHRAPSGMAGMRRMKAEGGWAVICTEVCEIHPSADVSPHSEARLWDDADIPALARAADGIHQYGALAGVELGHHGFRAQNRTTREVPMGPSSHSVVSYDPVHSRMMDKQDIRNLLRWQKSAALRAKRAGFDVIYVYAAHGLTTAMQFLTKRYNQRIDEYGGSLENRVRLLREMIEVTKDAVGDTCAVPVRICVDELLGPGGLCSDGEGREVIEMLADLPDLWDLTVGDYSNDARPSRFGQEGAHEDYVSFVKQVTGKPVVGNGRFTSPDTMVSQVRRGVLDFIGAARPSIADPFLPRKVEEGRMGDIRECIGCNICVAADNTYTPIRCTQNPTMGEEWRRGWHPEYIPERESEDQVLVVGAGPAGLECAVSLGKRGYDVLLAEASEELGGRSAREPRLPGLAMWGRVREYRVEQLNHLPNVQVYPASRMTAQDVLDTGANRIVIATGSHWRRDGVARYHRSPISDLDQAALFTPDDVMDGKQIEGPVILYDDDHYYMGGVIAEKLRLQGLEVTLVTPAPLVSAWTVNTLEQTRIQRRLLEIGVQIRANEALVAFHGGEGSLACVFTGNTQALKAQSVVMVTARLQDSALYDDLLARSGEWAQAGIKTVDSIGDALAPGTIAAAVFGGHRYARELDQAPHGDDVPFLRENAQLGPWS
ncbi:MAG: FAD-dependent oxidoreductase [Alphaproteobacteria bacterium]|nr:FAD-dependent oxidoreductase [Alphaproteobacteria bacterium]MBU0794975.1 FAD-dependent oxidoreductase [Alphaproteobacteria bacterium]MBU0876633.1 FAD-dependent oxidoreductase [Alphaproteobacteria bacterium]MBU1769335.1 FAD-dependent oxidoreductase [Alphaproteobacteria bacterium]